MEDGGKYWWRCRDDMKLFAEALMGRLRLDGHISLEH